jgi:hypothetical protein
VAVALLLHTVLENHGDAENENEIDADNAKGGSEDLVEVPVGKRGELANASALLRSNKGVQARGVLYERRRGRVGVATAVELDLVSSWLHTTAFGTAAFVSTLRLPTWVGLRPRPKLVLMESAYLLLQETLDKR